MVVWWDFIGVSHAVSPPGDRDAGPVPRPAAPRAQGEGGPADLICVRIVLNLSVAAMAYSDQIKTGFPAHGARPRVVSARLI